MEKFWLVLVLTAAGILQTTVAEAATWLVTAVASGHGLAFTPVVWCVSVVVFAGIDVIMAMFAMGIDT